VSDSSSPVTQSVCTRLSGTCFGGRCGERERDAFASSSQGKVNPSPVFPISFTHLDLFDWVIK